MGPSGRDDTPAAAGRSAAVRLADRAAARPVAVGLPAEQPALDGPHHGAGARSPVRPSNLSVPDAGARATPSGAAGRPTRGGRRRPGRHHRLQVAPTAHRQGRGEATWSCPGRVSRKSGCAGPSLVRMQAARPPARSGIPRARRRDSGMGATVEFCGEEFVAGRGPAADHRPGRRRRDRRQPLPAPHLPAACAARHGLWWLANVGSTLTATVADQKGLFQAWLSPGRADPAGARGASPSGSRPVRRPTTSRSCVDRPPPSSRSRPPPSSSRGRPAGETTVGRVSFTPDQKLLMVALCEGFLRSRTPGPARSRRRQPPPSGSAGRSPSSTASSTTSARSSPMPARAACTAGRQAREQPQGAAGRARPVDQAGHRGRPRPPRRTPASRPDTRQVEVDWVE